MGQSSPLGQVLASALQCLHEDPRASEERIRERMELQGRQTTQQLERFLPALATIASIAPLLGLLGTVVGMIEIFGADQAVGGNQPVQLAHGISVALYNTAFGLIVAIPSLMAWRYFRATVDRHILALESSSERFVRHLRQLRG
jgi:biopolymer transport protein ExbB